MQKCCEIKPYCEVPVSHGTRHAHFALLMLHSKDMYLWSGTCSNAKCYNRVNNLISGKKRRWGSGTVIILLKAVITLSMSESNVSTECKCYAG